MTARWEILDGDARERLRELPDQSVQTCVTSPPYFGLRDYGVVGQIGLEDTLAEYVAALVEVFREVHRVLRDDGTLWLVLGDAYAGSGGAQGHRVVPATKSGYQVAHHPKRASRTGSLRSAGVKPKDLYGIPWTVAFALRDDGWYVRSEVIWSKPAPMPESVRDRPTRSHEHVFLFSKRARYFYDGDAIREPAVSLDPTHSSFRPAAVALADGDGRREFSGKYARSPKTVRHVGRNKRSVWTVPTRPFKGAHFATFPPDLVEPMILAGTAPVACGVCGAPYRVALGDGVELDESRPQTHRALDLARRHGLTDAHLDAIRAAGITDAGKTAATQTGTGRNDRRVQQLAAEAKAVLGGYYREFLLGRPASDGWTSSCEHGDASGRCVVLDPCAGAGTTGLVAARLGRAFLGIELNPAYAELARRRILDDAPLLRDAAHAPYAERGDVAA